LRKKIGLSSLGERVAVKKNSKIDSIIKLLLMVSSIGNTLYRREGLNLKRIKKNRADLLRRK
jgi:hypothetical protein